jgi:hypothetical protein
MWIRINVALLLFVQPLVLATGIMLFDRHDPWSPGDPSTERLLGLLTLRGALDSFAALSLVVAAVLYLRWVHTAFVVGRHLSVEGLDPRTPGGAVAAYLLPFVFLLRPYNDLIKLVAGCDPKDLPPVEERVDEDAAGYRANFSVLRSRAYRAIKPPLLSWWLTWLASWVLLARNRGWGSWAGANRYLAFTPILGALMAVASAVAVSRIMTRVNEMQRERFDRLLALRLKSKEERQRLADERGSSNA